MMYGLLSDVVVACHLAFVLYAVFGAFLVFKWPRLAWLHIPAASWAVLIEFAGWICPLTPLENWLRLKGGHATYEGDFVGNYIIPLLYPSGLTREVQILLGAVVIGMNICIYGYVFRRRKRIAKDSGKQDPGLSERVSSRLRSRK